ncbi:MAG: aminomethyl-transferring glycine dehydrogenase subunit GcvPB [Candidatus Bathyarchaeota archaeon]|nr:MAG: aminomethyl-transferring glycine dehydrogenase subunit GcvPB [Candidatus Bathyarchaeota archaeon]
MPGFRQTRWSEPTVFELGCEGRSGYLVPPIENPIKEELGDIQIFIPERMRRQEPPKLPELSEVEVVRHFTRLSQMNYCVDLGFYPLGSCTMKYNPKINDYLASLPSLNLLHPYQDEMTVQGVLEILHTLSRWLAEITGTYEVSLQPAAGAHGEFLGALIMRAYHMLSDDLSERTELIIPDSAHGTNPASAAMAGFKAIIVPSDKTGCIDVDALKSAVSNQTAGLMLTNPNTLGIFEENIAEIAGIIHDVNGLLYYDGANLNAILGKVRPGDMGFDIVHINIHKTFGAPHGGGGPGAGPLGVSEELAKFLPVPRIIVEDGKYRLDYNQPHSIGKIRSFYGNISVLIRAYAYILSLGAEGLKETAEISVLNTNYLIKKIRELDVYKLPYDSKRPRKHECVFSTKPLLEEKGIRTIDISKRLLDYGIHSPTIYFPMIVEEAMMIEPTESFEKEELDRFVEVLRKIAQEVKTNPELVFQAPKNTAVTRLDEMKASHPKTMTLSWRMHIKGQSNL